MSELSYGDKIFKLLQKLERNINKPDLHSFTAWCKDCFVFVEAKFVGEIYIEEQRGNECITWAGYPVAAANRLERLGIDLDSVEI
ncbi:MAG: hypothetical protein ABFD76_06715 [Smithella sp.]